MKSLVNTGLYVKLVTPLHDLHRSLGNISLCYIKEQTYFILIHIKDVVHDVLNQLYYNYLAPVISKRIPSLPNSCHFLLSPIITDGRSAGPCINTHQVLSSAPIHESRRLFEELLDNTCHLLATGTQHKGLMTAGHHLYL